MAFFGVSWKQYISVSHDNRVCLFDSEAKTESRSFVEKNHLTHTYTSYDWLGGKLGERDLFAAGCSDGTVVLWDLTRGVVAKTFSNANKAAPTSMNFSLDRKSLYVCAGEGAVLQYDVRSGEQLAPLKCGKKPVLKLRCNPKANVMAIATSSSVRLLDLDDTEQKKKCKGSFAGGVACLAFSQCGRFLACAGATSREVVIYDVQAGGDSESEGEVAIMCTVPTAGVCASLQVYYNKHSRQLYVGAVLRDKDASVLRIHTKSGAFSTGVISTQSKAGDRAFSMFALTFDSSSKTAGAGGAPTMVHMALGTDRVKPQFQTIACEDSKGALLENVAVVYSSRATKAAVEAPSGASEAETAAAVAVVGPLDTVTSLACPQDEAALSASTPKRKGSDLEDPMTDKKKAKKARKEAEAAAAAAEAELTASGKKKSVSFVLDGVLGEVQGQVQAQALEGADGDAETLEQRLEALTASLQREGEGSDGEGEGEGAPMEAPTSDSLVVLLEQSLQSGDDVLLESCLACDDADVIDESSRRLPTARVVQFLRKLVTKFEKRPARGALLTQWLAGVLKYHLAYLVSVPDLALQLAGLSQMLENRLSAYSRLASLSGRLDLVVGQAQLRASTTGSAGNPGGSAQPVVVYDA